MFEVRYFKTGQRVWSVVDARKTSVCRKIRIRLEHQDDQYVYHNNHQFDRLTGRCVTCAATGVYHAIHSLKYKGAMYEQEENTTTTDG